MPDNKDKGKQRRPATLKSEKTAIDEERNSQHPKAKDRKQPDYTKYGDWLLPNGKCVDF